MAEKNKTLGLRTTLEDCIKTLDILKAKQMLENGADPNCENNGVTPMHLAAGMGVEPLCLLLQYNGNPNTRVHDGTTPVHVAAMWGFSDCMQILLANGGDPYLRDQEGLTAIDFAKFYQKHDVLQVLQQYQYMLNCAEEQTLTPRYTYKRLSVDSICRPSQSPPGSCHDASNTSIQSDPDLNNTQDLKQYLQEFTLRRHSSLYQRSVQKQVDRYFGNGQKTHLVDVTSPDHPYIEQRVIETKQNHFAGESPDYHPNRSEDSLHLRLSLSDTENQSGSCDSYVTCDGEDLDTVLRRSKGLHEISSPESPRSPQDSGTVVKNPYYVNPNIPHSQKSLFSTSDTQPDSKLTSKSFQHRKRSGEYRKSRYAPRKLPSPVQSQELFSINAKCDFCGGKAEKCIADGTVCESCEKLGLELDKLVGDSVDLNNCAFLNDLKCSVTEGEKKIKIKANQTRNENKQNGQCLPDLLEKLPHYRSPDLEKKTEPYSSHKNVNRIEQDKYPHVIPEQKLDDKGAKTPVKNKTGKTDLNDINELTTRLGKTSVGVDPVPFSQDSRVKRPGRDYQLDTGMLNDSLVSHISSTVCHNELDKARLINDSVLTLDDTYLDRTEHAQSGSATVNIGFTGEQGLNMNQKTQQRKISMQDENKENVISEVNDLWTQLRECKHARLKNGTRKDILDTAFCGRDSINSYASDTTLEYIYTDTENGIALIERHLPSLCGSQGSRRSLDSVQSAEHSDNSTISQGTSHVVQHRSHGQISDLSQDTVLYDWRENAMIINGDSGIGSSQSQPNSCPLSQGYDNLDNEALRAKLSLLGDNPGPVTTTTRQAYLKRLSQFQTDPDRKLITRKSPDYPAELQQALAGNLDMSEMPALEDKMMSAFQKPDRLRRWREGTLKSSFNYILLDPRITKNLPNRACNMSDKDVFKTFIEALFYVGKGKRARPYAHLYEAIKQQKKNVDKVSEKVQQILDIWDSGLGVVSLHCFQSVIPVEAYTREACMVDAIGLTHLTNKKRGDYYGVSVTFSMKERRKMGVYLLKKALQIFLAEGERQIAPLDIKKDP